MRVLVLGACGFIGSAVARELLTGGSEVVGLGRDIGPASRAEPAARWIAGDLTQLTTVAAWLRLLQREPVDAIVNCAGVLQDGSRDDVDAVQSDAIRALIAACEQLGIRRFVQISAPRAAPDADTGFMRSKGVADNALAASALDWWILRPGLVLGPQAYGGSALLRALAAMPGWVPVVHAASPVQTVAVADVATAVRLCLDGRAPARHRYDLVEPSPQTLATVVSALRAWLGLRPAPVLALPAALARPLCRMADLLAWLGWRSPLRSTALREIAHGVRGDGAAWRDATGMQCSDLATTLQRMPATVQERWFARLFLLKPLLILTLAAFWGVTAAVTLANPAPALALLGSARLGSGTALAIIYGGAALDALLALAILHRHSMRGAALGMMVATAAYLLGATLLLPVLWLDPLGPLLKPIPAAMLALTLLAIADDR